MGVRFGRTPCHPRGPVGLGFLAYGNRPHQMPVELPAATDNRGNKSVLKKQSTTKWPLMLISMQLSHLLRLACLRLNLQWKPCAQNDLADQLTNEVFESFDPAKRVSFSFRFHFSCFQSFGPHVISSCSQGAQYPSSCPCEEEGRQVALVGQMRATSAPSGAPHEGEISTIQRKESVPCLKLM